MNKFDDNYIKKFQKEELSKMINIEICKSDKAGTWHMRIGDIEGAVDVYNMDKEDILDLISEEMK